MEKEQMLPKDETDGATAEHPDHADYDGDSTDVVIEDIEDEGEDDGEDA